jgi:nucleoside phosphorylase
MIDLLIVSAFEPELEGLTVPLGRAVTVGDRKILAMPVGVGAVNAAAGTAVLIARESPHAVVFVGTAGVFPAVKARFPLHASVVAKETSAVDLALVRRLAERPKNYPDRFDLDATIGSAFGMPIARVATTGSITTDDALASELGDIGFDLENLELCGVAAACARAQVPCTAVLGISNVVGKEGREEWSRNHKAAARAAAERIITGLKSAAPQSEPKLPIA